MSSARATRDYDHLFKLVLIGDSGVGKSCLLLRFADDAFTESYITTIGVDFRFRTITVDGKVIKLQIWDTAGQERFRTITSAYYRGADGILLVYDTSSRESYNHIDDWLSEVNRFANENTCKTLVGNKCDLKEAREVTAEEADAKAKELKLEHIEASARDSINVDEAFTMIAKELLKYREANPTQGNSGNSVNSVRLASANTSGDSSGGGCC